MKKKFVSCIVMGVLFFITGCGGSSNVIVKDCGRDEACFEKQFALCSPAKLTQVAMEDELVFEYTILGPQQGNCEVRSMFIKSPEARVLNKEMICGYNSTNKTFDVASQDLLGSGPENIRLFCRGPLIDELITGETTPATPTSTTPSSTKK
jgi:hypothetical protein